MLLRTVHLRGMRATIHKELSTSPATFSEVEKRTKVQNESVLKKGVGQAAIVPQAVYLNCMRELSQHLLDPTLGTEISSHNALHAHSDTVVVLL